MGFIESVKDLILILILKFFERYSFEINLLLLLKLWCFFFFRECKRFVYIISVYYKIELDLSVKEVLKEFKGFMEKIKIDRVKEEDFGKLIKEL